MMTMAGNTYNKMFGINTIFIFIVVYTLCLNSISVTGNVRKAIEIDELLSGPYDFKDQMRIQNGGQFLIGINDPKSDTGEYPVRRTEVKPFYMDVYPVTVAQYWRYKLRKKKYRTAPEKSGYSWVMDKYLTEEVITRWSWESADPWWLAVKGAQWNRPEGPGSHVRDRLDYPVVHVSHQDARMYCQSVGKRLPLQEEWEFAARADLLGMQYPWGDKFKRGRMNVWQGTFPDNDKASDGWPGLSPVDAFPPQNNHSMCDMLGNVWEWTKTKYYERNIDRNVQPLKYVLKGGSFMDTRDGKYNYAVRTAQRTGQPPQYTAYNVGFRCAATARHLIKAESVKAPQPSTSTKRAPRFHRLEEMANQPAVTQSTRIDRLRMRQSEF